jgi:DNA-directed RNA polymerase specialized sigma subunit
MIVEYRFFGGMELNETAALLDVSESTIVRDWRAARAWLGRELRRAG